MMIRQLLYLIKVLKLGAWTAAESLQELFELYLTIDSYGKNTVENLIRSESTRCQKQGTSEDVAGIEVLVTFKQ